MIARAIAIAAALFGAAPVAAQRIKFLGVAPSAIVSTAYLPTLGSTPWAYCLTRCVSGYSGPAVTVVRASDSTSQNIGFAAGSDALDAAALGSFLSGTTGKVTIWYDQSGAGANLTGVSTTNLSIIPSPGVPRIAAQNVSTAQFLTIPSAVTFDRQNASIFIVGAVTNTRSGGFFGFANGATAGAIGLTDTISTIVGSGALVDNVSKVNVSADGAQLGATNGTASVMIDGMVSSSSSILIHRDSHTTTSSTGAATSLTVTGGTLGKANTAQLRGNLLAFVVYPAALSSADQATLKTALRTIYNTNPVAPTNNIIGVGDSKMYGLKSSLNNTMLRLVAEARQGADLVRDIGVSSSAVTGNVTLSNNYNVEPGALNVAIMGFGTNDLTGTGVSGGAPQTAAQIWEAYGTFIHAARGFGWTKFAIQTVTPRTVDGTIFTSAMEAQRVLLNAKILANDGNRFDAVADYTALSSQLGADGAPVIAMFPDGLHENDAGYAVEAPVANAALTVAIGAALKPSCYASPTISGTPGVGNTLTGSRGSWDRPTITYTDAWLRDGTAIAGATSTTYVQVSGDSGHVISYAPTATNAAGASTAHSDPVSVP